MSEKKKMFGLENYWIVYIIGTASLLEASIFLFLHYLILFDTNALISDLEAQELFVIPQLYLIRSNTYACFAFQGLRFIFALALIVARLKGYLIITAVNFVFIFIGMMGTIPTGYIGLNYDLTQRVAIASIAIIALHVVYIVICVKIYRQDHNLEAKEGTTSNLPNNQVQFNPSRQVSVKFQ